MAVLPAPACRESLDWDPPSAESLGASDRTPVFCTRPLFDPLVRAAQQREWDGEAERFGSLEVYDQLDFRRLLDRQITRLLSLKNFPGVDPHQTVIFRFIASVAHQAAGPDERGI